MTRYGVVLLCALALQGCAGSVDVGPMLDDFDRYQHDLLVLGAGEESKAALATGQEKRARAGALADEGKGNDALPVAEAALADARLALEMETMTGAARRAGACRLEVERARTQWREAMHVLEQTEAFVGTRTRVARLAPEFSPDDLVLPETTLNPDGFPPSSAGDVSSQWSAWRRAARDRKVASADLENVFEKSHAATRAEKVEADALAHHVYLAARTVQTLECRVRADLQERVCMDATRLTSKLGDARAAALAATLDLERGLQSNLRRELEQLRSEAKSRQDELFDALKQMEGKFASIRRDARGTIVSLADILFDFDKSTLRRNVEFNLVKIATVLNQYAEMAIVIEGHTDSIGTDAYNLDLSKRRAHAVYEFLVSQDVDPERVTYEGYGESRPVADNADEQGRQRNRRVDLVIQDAP